MLFAYISETPQRRTCALRYSFSAWSTTLGSTLDIFVPSDMGTNRNKRDTESYNRRGRDTESYNRRGRTSLTGGSEFPLLYAPPSCPLNK